MTKDNGKVMVTLTIPALGQVSGTMSLGDIMSAPAGGGAGPGAPAAVKATKG